MVLPCVAGSASTEGTTVGSVNAISEQEESWLQAYEANGPEGAGRVPMQRASWLQIGMTAMILLGTGTAAWMTKKDACPCNGKE